MGMSQLAGWLASSSGVTNFPDVRGAFVTKKQRGIVWTLIGIVTVVFLFLTATDAKGHTDEELAEWHELILQLTDYIDPVVYQEMRDVISRHPCYFEPEVCQQPTQPTPRPAPSLPTYNATYLVAGEQWRSTVAQYFPTNRIDWAVAIIGCESRGDPMAVGDHNDSGLFQFIRGTWGWVAESTGSPAFDEARFDVHWQMTNAVWLLSHGGAQHWTCNGKI